MTATITSDVTIITVEKPIAAEELFEYIGHHITTYRTRSGLTQHDLACLVHRSLSTVNGWENGVRGIALADLLMVARVLGKSMRAFLPRGEDNV